MSGTILVAGIGNIFYGDDAFGVEVVAALKPVPENVRVVDFGIRGFDLMMALMEGYDLTIFVDAMQCGGVPGTLYIIEPESAEADAIESGHGLDPAKVLAIARKLGAPPGRVLVIGCEPATVAGDTGQIGLSGPVRAAVRPAIEMIHSVIAEFTGQAPDRKVCAA